jgi:hypothetical protein
MTIKWGDKEIHISMWILFSAFSLVSGVADAITKIAAAKNGK